MSHTKVSHVSLTVSTVKVFIEVMQLINEAGLWEELEAYLEENGKTDLFVDYEVFSLLWGLVEQDSRFDRENRLYRVLARHDRPD